MKNNHHEWIDIAKGLLIILVVFGHTAAIQFYSEYHSIIYWFHMPAFFVISGILHRPVSTTKEFKIFIKKRLIKQFKSYALFIAIITSYRYLFTPIDHTGILNEFKSIVLGGSYIDGYYAPIWFITCLLFTQILFSLITVFIRRVKLQLLLVAIFFFLAHLESQFLPNIKIPWNLDVAFFALFFFAIGHFFRDYMKNVFIGLVCIMGLFLTLASVRSGNLVYLLDMKQHSYNHIFLDAIIPLFGTGALFMISQNISREGILNKSLSLLGHHSLHIMYLHLLIAVEIKRLGIYDNMLYFVIFGLLGPIIAVKIIGFLRKLYKKIYASTMLRTKSRITD